MNHDKQNQELLEILTSLPSYSKRINYAKEHFEYVGSGSSRSVFILDDNRVLKIAKNKFGEAQNTVEGDWSLSNMYGDIVAKTLFVDDDNYSFIISERAYPVAKSNSGLDKILKKNGVEPEEFESINKYLHRHLNNVRMPNDEHSKFNQLSTKYAEHEFVGQMIDMCINFNILPGDFSRCSSWGAVKDDDGSMKLCVKDFGLNVDNHNEFIINPMKKKAAQYRGY